MISIIVLAIVFLLIAFRQIGGLKLKIWQIVLGGAIAVLVSGEISIHDALISINLDVIFFLFGMFITGQALIESGYLAYLSYNTFKNIKSAKVLLLILILLSASVAAVLMNDTAAIVGTPVVLLLARKHKLSPKLLMLTLAFAVTTGSVLSPIGNPQNLLIALNDGIANPFLSFIYYLGIPTVINLIILYFVLRIYFKDEFGKNHLNHIKENVTNKRLANLSKISLLLILILIAVKVIFIAAGFKFNFKLTYIALAAALPPLIFGKERIQLIKGIDWYTLIFFASLFILMQSVWNSGFFQSLIKESNISISSIPAVLIISSSLSQLISNVPLVALYMPMLSHLGISVKGMMALAAGSTIAGNLFILGAASNIIIIQNAEENGGHTITFFEFAKIGIPLTLAHLLVYYIYFLIV